MRLKAVLTPLLVLGMSSVAMAHPRVSRTHTDRPYGYQVRAYSQPYRSTSYTVQTYAYGQDPYQANIARDEWSLLADGVSLASRQASVPLGNAHLAAVELQAEQGDMFVRDVIVDLDDGRQVTVHPNRPLDPVHAPNLRVDLGAGVACGIRQVSIVGDGSPWARFRVIGG